MYINTKQIAIILGAYNAEKYIAEQLESLIAQTNKDWSLYVRDDDSTDNTLSIIKGYCKRYDNIFLIEDSEGNLGCNGNYYKILEQVDSKYYMFANADDFWYDFKIQLSFDLLKKGEKLYTNTVPLLCHTDLTIGDANLNVIEKSLWEFNNSNPEYFKTYNKIGVCCVTAGATMIFNRSLKEIIFPAPKGRKDLFFDNWIALCITKNKGVILTLHQPTIIYRQIGTNLAAPSIGS